MPRERHDHAAGHDAGAAQPRDAVQELLDAARDSRALAIKIDEARKAEQESPPPRPTAATRRRAPDR